MSQTPNTAIAVIRQIDPAGPVSAKSWRIRNDCCWRIRVKKSGTGLPLKSMTDL